MALNPGLVTVSLAAWLGVLVADAPAQIPAQRGNLAVAANVSTSYVSGHETLAAVNDGVTPRSSRDTSHGAYGNWPRQGVQWIQYSWTKPVTVNGVSVYWYDDNRGVRVPKAARLLRWDGNEWTEIKAANGATLALKKDAKQFAHLRSRDHRQAATRTDRRRQVVDGRDRVDRERRGQFADLSASPVRPGRPNRETR